MCGQTDSETETAMSCHVCVCQAPRCHVPRCHQRSRVSMYSVLAACLPVSPCPLLHCATLLCLQRANGERTRLRAVFTAPALEA